MAMKRILKMSVVLTVIACGVLYGQRALVSAAPAGEAAASLSQLSPMNSRSTLSAAGVLEGDRGLEALLQRGVDQLPNGAGAFIIGDEETELRIRLDDSDAAEQGFSDLMRSLRQAAGGRAVDLTIPLRLPREDETDVWVRARLVLGAAPTHGRDAESIGVVVHDDRTLLLIASADGRDGASGEPGGQGGDIEVELYGFGSAAVLLAGHGGDGAGATFDSPPSQGGRGGSILFYADDGLPVDALGVAGDGGQGGDASAGQPGQDGEQGAEGGDVIMKVSCADGKVKAKSGRGRKGGDGANAGGGLPAGKGGDGGNGGDAVAKCRPDDQPCKARALAGYGGFGGKGGDGTAALPGGNGGNGGDGGKATAKACCDKNAYAKGRFGGMGGKGGKGCPGGDGGDAGDGARGDALVCPGTVDSIAKAVGGDGHFGGDGGSGLGACDGGDGGCASDGGAALATNECEEGSVSRMGGKVFRQGRGGAAGPDGGDPGGPGDPGVPGGMGPSIQSCDDDDDDRCIDDSDCDDGDPCTEDFCDEDIAVCQNVPQPCCGDDNCGPGEDCESCPEDCGPCPNCGDGICGAGEDCENCQSDCGPCECTEDADCPEGEVCQDDHCGQDQNTDITVPDPIGGLEVEVEYIPAPPLDGIDPCVGDGTVSFKLRTFCPNEERCIQRNVRTYTLKLIGVACFGIAPAFSIPGIDDCTVNSRSYTFNIAGVNTAAGEITICGTGGAIDSLPCCDCQ